MRVNEPTEGLSGTASLTPPTSLETPALKREALWFFLISLALCLSIFWPSTIGRKMLVPLDIPPNLFSKYKFMDPQATGVPANHYVIDQVFGELPRNFIVYEAWHRGEMPWWDPYTDAGKPLAPESNVINVSDPWKVILYFTLPFELAYNWSRIIPFLVSGLGAFLLLRRFKFGFTVALWGGLLYQFFGGNAIMFSGPTIQACCAYLPFLWLMWDKAMVENRLKWFALSSLVAAVMFLSGNLQSHSFLFLFATAFVLGYGWGHPSKWRLLLGGTAICLILGLGMASPFILSQIELFRLSVRKISASLSPMDPLCGVLSLSTVFPWALGTFRTLDISKITAQYALGFWPFIGSSACLIALFGIGFRLKAGTWESFRKRTALALVLGYFVICSTPLVRIFYTRIAWLAVMGAIVLFAFGFERLRTLENPCRRWGWSIMALGLSIALVLNVAGFLIFPRYQSKLESYVLKKQDTNVSLDQATQLRKFQVANLPREITFLNIEPLLSFVSMLGLAVCLIRPPTRNRKFSMAAIMVLSTIPLLLFVHRYIPQQPTSLWQSLREGGPEQHRALDALTNGLRLREVSAGIHEWVFPGAFAQLYGVHSLQGHTSLSPTNASMVLLPDGQPDPMYHDVTYTSPERGLERGQLQVRTEGPPARFHWAAASDRKVAIRNETLDTITLDFGPGAAGELIRTDTYYPGWQVAPGTPGVTMVVEPPFSARLHIPEGPCQVKLMFEPRFWRLGIMIAAASLLLLILSLVWLWRANNASLAVQAESLAEA
jgi:hypothetical protein